MTGARARTIRARVIAALLLGAEPARPGTLPGLRLTGARVTGTLVLRHADIAYSVLIRSCEFEGPIELAGARIRQLDLTASRLAGLDAELAQVSGSLQLTDCVCDGQVRLIGAHIAGRCWLERARLNNPRDIAFYASRLRVGDDLFSAEATVDGEYRLAGAQIGGTLVLTGATLRNPGGRAFWASNMSVGAALVARDGFTADGTMSLSNVRIGDGLDLSGARLSNPGADALFAGNLQLGTSLKLSDGFIADGAVRLPHAAARELVLRPAGLSGEVDLSQARFEVIRDDPATWPRSLNIDGLVYDALDPRLPATQRLRWLSHDPEGRNGYQQLAAVYRNAGDDAGARTVLLAGQRQHWRRMKWYARLWGALQDVTVGYGYRPLRAATWLGVLLTAGTGVFALDHPAPVHGAAAPAFNPFLYTLDLLIPLADLGQKHAYEPQGALGWFAYALIAAGWLFATTIATSLARILRRD